MLGSGGVVNGATSREVRLAARPQGRPKATDFEIAETVVANPAEGEVVVRNLFMSVDPYMRGRMNDIKSYVPPFELGKAMQGGAVGEVVASNDEQFQLGDFVLSMYGWREYSVSPGEHLTKLDRSLAEPQAFLGALGMTGLTAYAGLLHVGELKQGDRVFISAAAGAVGSIAGQIAKLKGCSVVGSCGSDEKVAMLVDELGFDSAFNYKTSDIRKALREHCPKGIDLYFENVGGEQLDAALARMRMHGRIVICGLIAGYNATELPPGPRNLPVVIANRLTIKGFIVFDHYDLMPQFMADMSGWLSSGAVIARETIVDGIENAPQAFLDLLEGEHKVGKLIVKLA